MLDTHQPGRIHVTTLVRSSQQPHIRAPMCKGTQIEKDNKQTVKVNRRNGVCAGG